MTRRVVRLSVRTADRPIDGGTSRSTRARCSTECVQCAFTRGIAVKSVASVRSFAALANSVWRHVARVETGVTSEHAFVQICVAVRSAHTSRSYCRRSDALRIGRTVTVRMTSVRMQFADLVRGTLVTCTWICADGLCSEIWLISICLFLKAATQFTHHTVQSIWLQWNADERMIRVPGHKRLHMLYHRRHRSNDEDANDLQTTANARQTRRTRKRKRMTWGRHSTRARQKKAVEKWDRRRMNSELGTGSSMTA